MSSLKKLRILITGCSPGGMGATLAIAFHSAGHHVYATARNPSKLLPLAAQGIETLTLDVTSASSIASAVSSISSSLPDNQGLDMLINNAASTYTMPMIDVSLDAARELFDLNVWSQLAVTQAFLPLLLRSSTTTASGGGHPTQAMIVNHTSVGSVFALPFQGIYNASKAALAMLSETMRLELSPFGIRVIDLKTAGVRTNLISNNNVNSKAEVLPEASIYGPAREVVESAMSQRNLGEIGITAEQWAAEVAALLLGKSPPAVIWRGESALMGRVASLLPSGMFEGRLKRLSKLDIVEEIIKEHRK
ncbi:short-chain dehydrogenase [Pseudomassariella vexata]|uniref:Short-chain dehydrogenase n=1 Tax=Pseudomassariella vexata TaxID=1141098 RepID=A0A1Y2EFA6_9PEZI|nr:short-chain dehydrogenase [Pseudomassariella vexata]ORY70263.1 short-chain dehydrogenase [Pseudomassariella vexata]